MVQLEDHIVVVTGAARGIGCEIALTLGREGGDVPLIARSVHALEEVADLLRSEGWRADVISPGGVKAVQIRGQADR